LYLVRRMIDAGRQRRVREMIEHHRRGQAPQQRGHLVDHLALHVELHVPAEIGDALRQRLDHLGRDRARARVGEAEADAANAAGMKGLELGVGDRRGDDRDAARARRELRDRVERHPVVGRIVARLHDDDARRPDPLLQQPVFRDGGVGRRRPRVRRHRKAHRVIDVHVAVGGVGRRLELGRLGAGRIRHLLGVASPGVESRGGCRDCRHRGSLDERATCDHFFLPDLSCVE
jgi:hypothetical protein